MFELVCMFLLITVNSMESENDNIIGIRKNIINLNENEKGKILNALYWMKISPSRYNSNYTAYDYFGYIHKLSVDPLLSYGHVQWSFLPWHRALLYLFEKELQFYANDNNVMLPYWDLSNQTSTHLVLNDTSFLGGNGNQSAQWMMNQENYALNCDKFPILDPSVNGENTANYTCLVRNIGAGRFVDNITYAQTLPNATIWNKILLNDNLNYDTYPYNSLYMNYSQYNTSFRAILEGCDPSWTFAKNNLFPIGICTQPHGTVHAYIGGQLASPSSPLDPLFFMLHNYIDLIWAKYQDKNGYDYTFPMQFINISLFNVTKITEELLFNNTIWASKHVLNHRKSLLYMYDVQVVQDSNDQENESWIYYLLSGVIAVVFIIAFIAIFCRYRNKKQSNYAKLI